MESGTEVKAKMLECVNLIITHWPAVQLALQEGWVSKNNRKLKDMDETESGPKSNKWDDNEDGVKRRFVEEVTNFIYDFDVDEYAIEDFLMDYIEDNFYIVLEDNSQRYTAKLLDRLNKSLSDGDDSVYEEIKGMAQKFAKTKGTEEKKEEVDKEGDDEHNKKEQVAEEEKEVEEEPPKLIDEDGFMTVTQKKGKKKH